MSAAPQKKLCYMVLRDFTLAIGTVGYFAAPQPYNSVLLLVGIIATQYCQRRVRKSGARLESSQKALYFGATISYFAILIGVIAVWALHRSSPGAWTIAGVAFVVLAVLLYASFDSIYGRNAKV